ncbi:transporter [Tenacibaculum aquimarinum]|uniref:transporter n=1 Tax=Tenacibaculum aquimarinum TaxID=2910675 RepID=UPI001F0B1D18|nr:transporter [Tenacibaculum aquimarinum]MCH3882438.1 transporter [Tenacibaculum aquimarinum]
MIKKGWLLLIICFSLTIQAQYTEVINSNRPGFSESPYSVGTGVYQFESTLFYRKADPVPLFSNPEAMGVNLLFRTSFFLDKLELNVNTTFEKDKIAFKNVFESSYNETGLSQLTLGAKYLVYQPTYADKSKEIRSWKKRMAFDWKRVIPAVAVYGGVNFGSILTDYHNRGGISPRAGVLLQNQFSHKFNLVTNFYYDYIGSDLPEFSHIVTATYNFDDYWSGFVEHQALYNDVESRSNLGLGAAYLFSKNLQFNASARGTFQENVTGFYGSLGVSYRIDRHQDSFIEVDEFGNEIKRDNTTEFGAKKGFFGRLFNGFGLFSKKNKTTTSSKTDGTRDRPTRQRKKAVTKKEKKGGFFSNIFGKKKKKEETEEEKLEREVKELEKQIKKDEKKAKKEARKNKKKNG